MPSGLGAILALLILVVCVVLLIVGGPISLPVLGLIMALALARLT